MSTPIEDLKKLRRELTKAGIIHYLDEVYYDLPDLGYALLSTLGHMGLKLQI